MSSLISALALLLAVLGGVAPIAGPAVTAAAPNLLVAPGSGTPGSGIPGSGIPGSGIPVTHEDQEKPLSHVLDVAWGLGSADQQLPPVGQQRPPARQQPPTAGPLTGDRDRTALWAWPLEPRPEIIRPYDPPAQRWLPGHRGVDLSARTDQPVLAVEAGVVTHSGEIAGVGTVSVTHADGLRSTYQPVTDRPERGTRVARGQQIGRLDIGGHCLTRPCLHLGAKRGSDYVDPTPLLLGVTLSLLPMGD
ncbi:M23 family metallopeptidase [Ornithinimicrobium sp. Y1694]|uniref:M23 family metallopeptidase n=1 Tax=Ornithinimicrobium sp. Y1694 TaxID=3418590 RepID=UPI003CF19149